jgi:hypothetical protein
MNRYVIVLGENTPVLQNSITSTIKNMEGVSWWHHLPTVWLVTDSKLRSARDWLIQLRAAAPRASLLIFDADGKQPVIGIAPIKGHAWLAQVWNAELNKTLTDIKRQMSDLFMWAPPTEGTDDISLTDSSIIAAKVTDDVDIIRFAPTGAIVDAWARLEGALWNAVTRLAPLTGGSSENVPIGLPMMLDTLLRINVIDDKYQAMVLNISSIRNQIVHNWNTVAGMSSDIALSVVRVAQELTAFLGDRVENILLKRILSNLRTDNAKNVTMWPLALVGSGSSSEAAEAMARARVGKWGANAGENYIDLTEDEVRLLHAHGATKLLANREGDIRLAALYANIRIRND